MLDRHHARAIAPDGLLARKESTTWTYYTFDHRGNVDHKLSSSQSVTITRCLDAWGQGVETVFPSSEDPWGYNGKWGYYYDRTTKLYVCQHRWYDASTGRWLNRDPIGFAGGVNVYGYCANAAVAGVDSSGLSISDKVTAAALIAAGSATSGEEDAAEEAATRALERLGGIVPDVNEAISDELSTVEENTCELTKNLRTNMQRAGEVFSDGKDHAAHIVAQTAKRAQETRTMLEGVGIYLHDPANGVLVRAATHMKSHTNEYYRLVHEILHDADGPDDFIEKLEKLGDMIKGGGFTRLY